MRTFAKAAFTALMMLSASLLLSSSLLRAQPQLIASWPFNNNSDDASGNEHHATLRGNAGYTQDAAKGSHSLMLNGAPDHVLVGPLDFGDEFTICAWSFLEPGVTNIQTVIGNAMGGSTVDGFKLFINNWETSNKRIIIETSDGVARLDAVSPENTFEEGFWNHVAVTMDRINGESHIYYNGEEVTESGAIVPNFQNTESVTIGSMSGPDWFWTGMIDDVRIYEGLLTIDDIIDVMDSPETGVHQRPDQNVTTFHLRNYPNPFNPHTTISFHIGKRQAVALEIVDVGGKHIRRLLNQEKYRGNYKVHWDGLDDLGKSVPSGVYLCRLRTPNLVSVRKMLLVR